MTVGTALVGRRDGGSVPVFLSAVFGVEFFVLFSVVGRGLRCLFVRGAGLSSGTRLLPLCFHRCSSALDLEGLCPFFFYDDFFR